MDKFNQHVQLINIMPCFMKYVNLIQYILITSYTNTAIRENINLTMLFKPRLTKKYEKSNSRKYVKFIKPKSYFSKSTKFAIFMTNLNPSYI